MVTKVRAFFIDLAERSGSTFVQVLLMVLVATQGATRINWANSLAIAAFAAFAAVLTTCLLWLGRVTGITNPYADLAYRTVVTFGQTLLGYVTAAGLISALDFNWNAASKAALLAAGVALLKGLIGLHAVVTRGASTFVPPATEQK